MQQSSREAAVGYLDILDLFRAVIEGRFNMVFSGWQFDEEPWPVARGIDVTESATMRCSDPQSLQ